jgi:hypothetical protein
MSLFYRRRHLGLSTATSCLSVGSQTTNPFHVSSDVAIRVRKGQRAGFAGGSEVHFRRGRQQMGLGAAVRRNSIMVEGNWRAQSLF